MGFLVRYAGILPAYLLWRDAHGAEATARPTKAARPGILFYVSRNRTVLATARDGFVHGSGEEGLFVCQTRILSKHRYKVNGKSPEAVGISNLEEHSQIAYYVVESPTADETLFKGALGPGGRAATEAIELRLMRFTGDGLAEEVELRNHTLRTASFPLELEIDADFAGANETHGKRKQLGQCERSWRADGIPALYPHADSPQAWSASGVWCMLQALLGIFPYAPLRALFVDPHLPEWLPDLEVRNLHVGDAAVDLSFHRGRDGSTSYRVLDRRGDLHIVRQASPWSLTSGFGERLVDALSSVLPGR